MRLSREEDTYSASIISRLLVMIPLHSLNTTSSMLRGLYYKNNASYQPDHKHALFISKLRDNSVNVGNDCDKTKDSDVFRKTSDAVR